MKQFCSSTAVLLVAVSAMLPATASAQEHLDRYERGFRAMRYGLFNEAAWWFRFAGESRSRPGGKPARLHGRAFTPYLPCYFEGVALFNAGRYAEAEARWRDCLPGLEEMEDNARDYEAMIEVYGAFISERRELVETARRVYAIGSEATRTRRRRLAAETFEQILMLDAAARLSGEPRERERLQALHQRLRQLGERLRIQGERPGSPGRDRKRPSSVTAAWHPWQQSSPIRPAVLGVASGAEETAEDYEGMYALLVAPLTYKHWKPIEGGQDSFRALREALGTKRGAEWFEIVLLPDPARGGRGGLTKSDFLDWFQNDSFQEWTAAGKKNLVMVVFAGHACNIYGEALAPLSDSPDCSAARADPEQLKKLAASSIWVRDIARLTEPQPFFEGDIAVLVDSCHAELFSPPGCLPPPGPAPVYDAKGAKGRSVTFVAAGRKDDVVEQFKLVDALTAGLNGCFNLAGETRVMTGYELVSRIELALLKSNQHVRKMKCHTASYREGDFTLEVTDRCSRQGRRDLN